MNVATFHTYIAERPAFRWRLEQPLAILLAAGLGILSGWAFGNGSNLGFAWMLFLFGFVWVLIISVALGMWLAVRSHLARGDWRAALHIGFASVFPTTTVYMVMVVLMTAAIPLVNITFPNGAHALARPDFLRHFPVLYFCSLIAGLMSGPLFALWSPWKRMERNS